MSIENETVTAAPVAPAADVTPATPTTPVVSPHVPEGTAASVVAESGTVPEGPTPVGPQTSDAADPMEVFKAAIDGLGIAPGVTTDLVVELAELAKGDELKADEKWVARIRKAIKPLDVMPRIKSQLHTAARKELDTEAMKYHRRTGKFKAVTDGDIETLYQEKLEAYLAKKAEKEAKKKAITKAS